eukprot:3711562-Rhodomonas_salina.1
MASHAADSADLLHDWPVQHHPVPPLDNTPPTHRQQHQHRTPLDPVIAAHALHHGLQALRCCPLDPTLWCHDTLGQYASLWDHDP